MLVSSTYFRQNGRGTMCPKKCKHTLVQFPLICRYINQTFIFDISVTRQNQLPRTSINMMMPFNKQSLDIGFTECSCLYILLQRTRILCPCTITTCQLWGMEKNGCTSLTHCCTSVENATDNMIYTKNCRETFTN